MTYIMIMSLQSFKDWFYSQESSAATRARNAAFWGLGPSIASPFSHSTPNPAMVDKLLDDLKPKKKKKKKKKKVEESHAKKPDYSFDTFIQRLQKASQDIDAEIKQAEKDSDDLERKFSSNKNKPIPVDKKKQDDEEDQKEEDDENENDDDDNQRH